MRKKEPWMKCKAFVLALGKVGKITKITQGTIGNIDYVYNFRIKFNDGKKSKLYHPNDIEEIK